MAGQMHYRKLMPRLLETRLVHPHDLLFNFAPGVRRGFAPSLPANIVCPFSMHVGAGAGGRLLCDVCLLCNL